MIMKSHSLIRKTMAQFFAYTAGLFMLMTPVFYFLTKYFYAENLMNVLQAIERHERIPDLDLEEDIIAGMMIHLVLIFTILLIALFIIMRFATKRLWKPFDDSLEKTERYSVTQSELPDFKASDVTEFNRLNESLTRLMTKSRKAYSIQKEFAENASHELQTPLAVTRSKLDLLVQENLTPGQLELVSDMYQINSRMEHLNRNLLLLAKIDGLFYEQREKLHLEEFIEKLMPSYQLLRTNSSVDFAPDAKFNSIIEANQSLLECLTNNLVVNAIRNTSTGNIIISTAPGPSLIVKNTATGKALDPIKIFDRFRSDGNRGTGLGLPIAKAISDYHGWGINYSCSDGYHIFTVTMNPPKR